MVVLAPMPMPSESTAVNVKSGLRRSMRDAESDVVPERRRDPRRCAPLAPASRSSRPAPGRSSRAGAPPPGRYPPGPARPRRGRRSPALRRRGRRRPPGGVRGFATDWRGGSARGGGSPCAPIGLYTTGVCSGSYRMSIGAEPGSRQRSTVRPVSRCGCRRCAPVAEKERAKGANGAESAAGAGAKVQRC